MFGLFPILKTASVKNKASSFDYTFVIPLEKNQTRLTVEAPPNVCTYEHSSEQMHSQCDKLHRGTSGFFGQQENGKTDNAKPRSTNESLSEKPTATPLLVTPLPSARRGLIQK